MQWHGTKHRKAWRKVFWAGVASAVLASASFFGGLSTQHYLLMLVSIVFICLFMVAVVVANLIIDADDSEKEHSENRGKI